MNREAQVATDYFFKVMAKQSKQSDEFGLIFYWVPWKWVSELDAKVDLLNADIVKHYEGRADNPEDLINGFWPFERKWDNYRDNWRQWYIEHQDVLTRREEEAEISFRAFRAAYDQLRTEFIEAENGSTKAETAKPWIETKPTDKTGPPSIGDLGGINFWPLAIGGVAILAAVVLIKR